MAIRDTYSTPPGGEEDDLWTTLFDNDGSQPSSNHPDGPWGTTEAFSGDANSSARGYDPVTAYEKVVVDGFRQLADRERELREAAESAERTRAAAAAESTRKDAAAAERLRALMTGLNRFYGEHRTLQAGNIAAVQAHERIYRRALAERRDVTHYLRAKGGLSGETAAIAFAAASMLSQNPGRPIDRIPGRRPPAVLIRNAHGAQRYLEENIELYLRPRGIWDFDDVTVLNTVGATRYELDKAQLMQPGYGGVPAVLAVIAAAITHSEDAAVLGLPKINRDLQVRGEELRVELENLLEKDKSRRARGESSTMARDRLASIRGNKNKDESNALDEAIRADQAEEDRVTRSHVIDQVLAAARIRYGNNAASYQH